MIGRNIKMVGTFLWDSDVTCATHDTREDGDV